MMDRVTRIEDRLPAVDGWFDRNRRRQQDQSSRLEKKPPPEEPENVENAEDAQERPAGGLDITV